MQIKFTTKTKHRTNNYKLRLHSHVKYLAMIIDEVLSWNKQIEFICMKLARANGILSKACSSYLPLREKCPNTEFFLVRILRKNSDLDTFHAVYNSLVWSYSRKSNIDSIIKLQKRCIWIINFSDFNFHTYRLFSELKLLKMNDIFSLSKILFMFDFIKKNISEELKRSIIFNKSLHSYETQSSQMFHIPKKKTSRFGLNTWRYDCAKLWNKFFHTFLHKETDLTNSKLKKFVKNLFL